MTLLVSATNISFATEIEQGEVTSYLDISYGADKQHDFITGELFGFNSAEYAEDEFQTSCIPSKQ